LNGSSKDGPFFFMPLSHATFLFHNVTATLDLSMKAGIRILVVLFIVIFLFPREAHVSGSAVGTITETYFEISGDDGLRIHFINSGEESKYHHAERAKIAAALRPLAGKIKDLLDRLRKKEPWMRLIQPYQAGGWQGADVDLKQFELASYGPLIAKMQEKGPYRYVTSFQHCPGKTRMLNVTVRFMFRGKVESESLYELEDALHSLRTPFPEDARYPANPKGVELSSTRCDEYLMELMKIRTAFSERLEKKKMYFRGHEQDGSYFSARLEGPELCLATFVFTLAGAHHWGRAKRAFVEASQSVFKRAIEWPGFPPDPHADSAAWRIVVDQGNY